MLAVVCDGCFPDAQSWWANSYAPFDYSGTISLSALLALAIPVAINRFLGREIAAKKAAKANGDLIECVIQNSLDEGTLVELTMNNGKSYIGFARESGVAVQGESDAALIPLASGYRDNDTRELEITTEYASVIERRIESNVLPNVSFDDFQIVLPTREIARLAISMLARTNCFANNFYRNGTTNSCWTNSNCVCRNDRHPESSPESTAAPSASRCLVVPT